MQFSCMYFVVLNSFFIQNITLIQFLAFFALRLVVTFIEFSAVQQKLL